MTQHQNCGCVCHSEARERMEEIARKYRTVVVCSRCGQRYGTDQ